MKEIILLGSTGSIGTQAIEVCQACGFRVKGLAAGHNAALLAQQARMLQPDVVCIADETQYEALKTALSDTDILVASGKKALCELAASPCDTVLNAVVGMAGLPLTMAALEAGNLLALANKESLVAGGELVLRAAKEHHTRILPVDSEHSAIFQCLQGCKEGMLHKILLTASGGPFFGKKRDELAHVSIEDALNHPNWSMGRKITVDSASLMNKGLEVIEACHLFSVSAEDVEVVVQRQSIIHSAVELTDHSVIAQMGVPDMKIPIQYALTYPDRVVCDVKPLSLTDIGTLTFSKPDTETFRCLPICMEAFRRGGAAPCAANAANEEAVALFLSGKIGFLQIADAVEAGMEQFSSVQADSLTALMELYDTVRNWVHARFAR